MIMEILKSLVQIEIGPNEFVFVAKHLLFVPLLIIQVWIMWRAFKSFFGKKA